MSGSKPLPAVFRDNPVEHQLLLKKLTWRLLPFLMVLYTFSFLDRSNLSNVHKTIVVDLDMTEEQYGMAASIFFIPYVILEVPSNMILQRVDARRWLARIIFTWGLFSTLMVFVNSFGMLCLLRFLLGVAEAGFFPGIVYYLTFWFTPEERAHRLFFIFVAQPVAGLMGGLLAYPIMEFMNGTGGLEGWRWVFLLEGLPTVILGVITWLYLPATPASASWLTQEEKTFLMERIHVNSGGDLHSLVEDTPSGYVSSAARSNGAEAESMLGGSNRSDSSDGSSEGDSNLTPRQRQTASSRGLDDRGGTTSVSSTAITPVPAASSPETSIFSDPENTTFPTYEPSRSRFASWYLAAKAHAVGLWHSTFSNRIIWYCIFVNYLTLTPVQAITFYLPAIVAEFGLGPFAGNLLSAIPYTVAALYMWGNSVHADYMGGERFWHVLSSNILGFIGLGLSAVALDVTHNAYFQLSMLCIAAAGIWGAKPPLMAWFTSSLPGNLAVAVAAVTTCGNVSGVTAPLIMSGLRAWSGNYVTGCIFLMACLVVASMLVVKLNRTIIHSELRDRAIKESKRAQAVFGFEE